MTYFGTDKKDIVASFGNYILLDTISHESKQKLLQALALASAETKDCCLRNSCIRRIQLNYTETYMPIPNKLSRHLRIDAEWCYSSHRCQQCRGMDSNSFQMHQECAQSLRTGKCKDEFMRTTIGAVLFPKLYAKDKQK